MALPRFYIYILWSDLQFEVDRVVRVRLPLEDAVVAPRLVRLVRRLEHQPVRLVPQARFRKLGAQQSPEWGAQHICYFSSPMQSMLRPLVITQLLHLPWARKQVISGFLA